MLVLVFAHRPWSHIYAYSSCKASEPLARCRHTRDVNSANKGPGAEHFWSLETSEMSWDVHRFFNEDVLLAHMYRRHWAFLLLSQPTHCITLSLLNVHCIHFFAVVILIVFIHAELALKVEQGMLFANCATLWDRRANFIWIWNVRTSRAEAEVCCCKSVSDPFKPKLEGHSHSLFHCNINSNNPFWIHLD